MKILITGAGNLKNNGIYAMVVATCEQIRKLIPDCEFYMISPDFIEDEQILENIRVKVIDQYWFGLRKKKVKFLFSCIFNMVFLLCARFSKKLVSKRDILNSFKNCDLIIDLSGDSISTDYGNMGLLFALYNLVLGLVAKKRIVLFCQTIGPFHNSLLSNLSIFVLNRVFKIILREKRSYDYLKSLKLKNKNIIVSTDCAFLLEPKFDCVEQIIVDNDLSTIRENKFIGISPSSIIHRWYKDPIDDRQKEILMVERIAEFLDKMIVNYDFQVIMIPHVTVHYVNDRIICQKIYSILKNKHKVRVLKKDYKANELKSLMSFCYLYISFRMHAAIGAISMGVPTICLSYNDKFEGVIGDNLGLSEYVINIRELSINESCMFLEKKVITLLNNYNNIKYHIIKSVSKAKTEGIKNIMSIIKTPY